MKRILATSLLVILLLTAFTGVAYADENELPDPGLLPDSPFYFLKSWFERLAGFFTFNILDKVTRNVDLAELRLAEARALAENGKTSAVGDALERYQSHLDQALAKADEAKANGLNVDEVTSLVAEATLKHQGVLADVYQKVPEEAKPAIEEAMNAGMRGHEEAVRAVSEENRNEVLENTQEQRQNADEILEEVRSRDVPGTEVPVKDVPVPGR